MDYSIHTSNSFTYPLHLILTYQLASPASISLNYGELVAGRGFISEYMGMHSIPLEDVVCRQSVNCEVETEMVKLQQLVFLLAAL